MSTSTEYMDGLNAPAERRFYSRVTPPTPIYVAFGSNNLGVLHNVSENGLQVTTPNELPINSVFRVFLSLNGAPKTIAVTVRTIWTNSGDKRSGIQLLDLADEDRQQIRDWVELELSRTENSTPWFLPKSGNQAAAEASFESRGQSRQFFSDPRRADKRSVDGRSIDGTSSQSAPAVPPMPQAAPKPATATTPVTETRGDEPRSAQSQDGLATQQMQPAETAEANPAAETEAELPHIANPFDEPSSNSRFEQFPSVPLPIHGEFEYAKLPSKQRRRTTNLSSHLRTKPLLIWAAVLAVVCFGANALVRYKIKLNAQRFATESAKYAPPKSDAARPESSEALENSGASTSAPSATDSQPTADSNGDASSNGQATSNTPTTTAQNDPLPAAPPTSRPGMKKADPSQGAPRQDSSVDARDNGAYAATTPPPASRRSEEMAYASQPGATQRSWTAPAPSRSASSSAPASEPPQSPNVAPNVTSASNNSQPQPQPIVSQTRPTPPPAPQQTQGTSGAYNSAAPSNSNGTANNTQQARTQPPANTESSTYAANTNATTSRQQSPIYNANAPQQRSPFMGSINSVHSSGIFDSNDTTSTSAAPPASRGSNANATRSVSNSTMVPSDTPQDHDVQIVAPKGFGASYVDVPGERVVRSAAGTVHIRRTVRVPGERIPGQRWLWKGKLDVTLGDVVSRIDPAVVQSAGASGSLTVQATIDKDGYVTDLKPLYGNFAMLPAVSRTVRNWHYDPTYLDNKRVETTAQVEFDLNPVAATNRTGRP